MITVSKILPTSSWYAGSGLATITLSGVNRIIVNTKKSLLKIQIPKSPSNSDNTGSDRGTNYVKDLKRVEDSMKLGGWLVDTVDSSAWTKAWKLRAMTAVGGPVSSLVIENQTFGTGSQQAFLEDCTFNIQPNAVTSLKINETSSGNLGVARIEVDLSFYLGDER